jgi:excisionase family DNA binding protein
MQTKPIHQDNLNYSSYTNRIALSVNEAAAAAGFSRQMIYNAINCGELRSAKIGKRRVITMEALRDWLRSKEREVAMMSASSMGAQS